MFSREDLKKFQPEHDFFVGIDSDGCAFPTMELKHKECFIPNIIKYWQLQSVSKYAREAAEFVNLYSKWRGINRFPALLLVFDLLRERQEVKNATIRMPEVPALQDWVEREPSLGNPSLKAEVERNPQPDLIKALQWSEAVNASIADMVLGVPPFPGVEESLERLNGRVDAIVVSATPGEALQREWREHGIDRRVRLIAGQELGKKKEHLELAASGKYDPRKMLMIGDAPGDRRAAEAVGALFYPINPGREEESWRRFHQESLDRFLQGTYAGAYEQKLIEDFEKLLPDRPPWQP